MFRLAVLSILPLALLPVQASGVGVDVVRTDAGLVRGEVVDSVRVFNGIPYAAPPTGRLRWVAPQPVRPWTGVRAATESQSPCPQQQNLEVPNGSTTEDCLYLNVTTPARQTARARPVVVWVPGGGFFSGAGSSYGPRKLVERGDVVVVTINYRLGIFGFFGHPGLPGSGTFGLQDQQAALRWVQRNARAFAGDPHNVTLAGESAGGMSVCAQLTSPKAVGLFSKVIMQSGSCAFNWDDNSQYPGQGADSPWSPQSAVRRNGAEVAASLRSDLVGAGKCRSDESALACVRKASAADLMPVSMAFTQPAYRSSVLPESPAKAMAAGRFHRVPVLSGNNHDEAASWLAAFNVSDENYPQLIADMVGPSQAAKVVREYPLSAYGSAAEAWTAVTTDRIWSCTQVQNDRQAARFVPTYAYEFADKRSPLAAPGQGAAHAVELPYLFSLGGYDFPLSESQQTLSNQMVDYWTAFARSGDPNGPARPHWAPTGTSAVRGLSLAPTDQGGITPVDLGVEHHCDFWAGID